MKTSDYGAVQGLLETPPRVRADSIQINSTQAQFISIQFNSIQIELELEMVVRVGLEIEKMLGNGCLKWLRLQNFQQRFEKISSIQFKSSSNWKWLFELAWKLKNPRNGCLSWLRLQKFQKQFEKLERADVENIADVKMSKAHYS